MTNGNDQQGLDPSALAELSRHYDSLLWTVTSLWAAAIGGLLLHSSNNFDPGIAVFGLGLTVCAMYFAYSFRRLRRRVNDAMPDRLRDLHTGRGRFRQWDAFALLFTVLLFLWSRLLINKAHRLWPLWLSLAIIAAVFIGAMWRLERGARNTDA